MKERVSKILIVYFAASIVILGSRWLPAVNFADETVRANLCGSGVIMGMLDALYPSWMMPRGAYGDAPTGAEAPSPPSPHTFGGFVITRL